MPRKPMRPCNQQGCAELISTGRYCIKHQRAEYKRQDDRRGSAAERGYGGAWPKIRAHQLRQHPLCERCQEQGDITAATLVHHIKRIAEGGSNSFDNLMSLCIKCHDAIHMEQGDKW